MKKLILASILLASSQVAMAVNWVYIGQNNKTVLNIKQNGEVTYGISDVYIDKDSILIKKTADGRPYISAWENTRYRTPFIATGQNIYQFKQIIYFDCNNKNWDSGYISAYDMNENTIIHNNNWDFIINNTKKLDDNFIPNNWRRVIPDTQMEKTFNTICSWIKQ